MHVYFQPIREYTKFRYWGFSCDHESRRLSKSPVMPLKCLVEQLYKRGKLRLMCPSMIRSPYRCKVSAKIHRITIDDQFDMPARMKTLKCPASRPKQPAWKPKIAVIRRIYRILLGYQWTRKLCQQREWENNSVIQQVSDFVDCLTGRNVEIEKTQVTVWRVTCFCSMKLKKLSNLPVDR